MSQSTPKEREKMSPDDFADPVRKLYPLMDASDIRGIAALLGKAHNPEAVKARAIKIAKRKGLVSHLPDAWKEDANMSQETATDAATFSSIFTLDSSGELVAFGACEMVKRKAPIIFRAGDYPDKNYSMTQEDILRAVSEFSRPVPIGLEHIPTILSGRLGDIVSLSHSDDGVEMSAEAMIPKWLDENVPRGDLKLSAEFDRKTKRLIGCSLVRSPRVSDAALMAAFSHTPGGQAFAKGGKQGLAQFDASLAPEREKALAEFARNHRGATKSPTKSGQKAMFTIHGHASKAGAVCMSGSKPAMMSQEVYDTKLTENENARQANFASSYEMGKIQTIHDVSSEGGKHCSFMSPAKMSDEDLPALFAKYGGMSPAKTEHGQKVLKKIHGSSVKFGAKCGAMFKDMPGVTGDEPAGDESGKLQFIHDLSSEAGEHCMKAHADQEPDDDNESGPLPEGGSDHEINDSEALNKEGDVGNNPPTKILKDIQPEPQITGETPTTASYKPDAKFNGDDKAKTDTKSKDEEESNENDPKTGDPIKDAAKMSSELAEMRAELEKAKAVAQGEYRARIKTEAAMFAKDEIENCRAMPAESDALKAEFLQAAEDDLALNNTVTFGGKSMSRVDKVREIHKARVPHNLTKELMPATSGGKDRVLFHRGAGEEPMTPEKENKYMNMTPLGRGMLNENGKK